MNLTLPWSGDVSQMINPWTLWVRDLNQQMGFININTVVSGDPEVEKKIIGEVAGYGRQIGWILEALNLVVGKLAANNMLENLSNEERATLNRLADLTERIEDVKYRSKNLKPSTRDVERLIDDIRRLKEKDRNSYEEIVSKIKDAF